MFCFAMCCMDVLYVHCMRIYACMRIDACVCMRIYACVCMRMYAYMCVYQGFIQVILMSV